MRLTGAPPLLFISPSGFPSGVTTGYAKSQVRDILKVEFNKSVELQVCKAQRWINQSSFQCMMSVSRLPHTLYSDSVCRLWTLHQSLYFGWCLVLSCTQPYPSSALCNDPGVASCPWLPAGFHPTVNIKFTQVNSSFTGCLFSSTLLSFYKFLLFFPLRNLCSAAVCSRPRGCAVLQLQRKHWERFDHGLCRSAPALKGLDQLHSACKCSRIDQQLSCSVYTNTSLLMTSELLFFYCTKNYSVLYMQRHKLCT